MSELNPEYKDQEWETTRKLLFAVKDAFPSSTDPDDLLELLHASSHIKKKDYKALKKQSQEVKRSLLWGKFWGTAKSPPLLTSEQLLSLFQSSTSEMNKIFYRLMFSLCEKLESQSGNQKMTDDTADELEDQVSSKVVQSHDSIVELTEFQDRAAINDFDYVSGRKAPNNIPRSTPWDTLPLYVSTQLMASVDLTPSHTKGEDGEMINIVPPGRVHLYSYEHGVSLYFPQGTLQEPLLLKFNVIPLDEASSSLRAYSAVFRFQVLGDTQWTVSSGHPIWLELPHFCNPGEDQTGFSQLVFFSRSSDSEPFVANTNGVFPLGYPYGGIPLYHFSDHFIGEKVKFNVSSSAVSSTAMNNVCISLQQPSMRHWRRAWNADLMALPLVPSYLSLLMGHYRESEWDSQLVRGFFHPSDEVLVSTNNVRCEGWEIKLPQDPRLAIGHIANIACQPSTDGVHSKTEGDYTLVTVERFVNGKVQKTTQFIATKEPSGQCFQLCSPCSVNFKLVPEGSGRPFIREISEPLKHVLEWPCTTISVTSQGEAGTLNTAVDVVCGSRQEVVASCTLTAKCLETRSIRNGEKQLHHNPAVLSARVSFFQNDHRSVIDKIHCMILVDISFHSHFSENLAGQLRFREHDVTQINSTIGVSSALKEKEFQLYRMWFQTYKGESIADLLDLLQTLHRQDLIERVHTIISKYSHPNLSVSNPHTPTPTDNNSQIRHRRRESVELLEKAENARNKLFAHLTKRINPWFWKMLGRLLGLAEQHLERIQILPEDLPEERTYIVLLTWAKAQEIPPKYSEVLGAIKFLSSYQCFSDAIFLLLESTT